MKTNIFKINYTNDMSGGAMEFFPNYPMNLGDIRSYDQWPPKKNSRITIQDNVYGDLPGIVVANIWNKTAAIIRLDNQNHPLVESSLVNEPNYNNGKGHYLLLADHRWFYPNDQHQTLKNIESNINHVSHESNKPTSSLNAVSNRTNDTNLVEVKDFMDYSNVSVTKDNFKSKDDSVMFMKPDSIIPNNQEVITENPLYSPLLTGSKKDYFSEKEIDIVLSNVSKSVKSLSSDKVNLLKKKLEHFEKISEKDIIIVVNKNLAIESLIENPEDEINEGNKIKIWIERILKKKLFPDLDIKIHSGYLYITREGIKVYDNIDKKLVPDLKYFEWQYDKPIDYHTLKYIIFQNAFQKNLQTNIIQKREAENILSQEYVIALQPSPYYVLWTIKRLIMLWYADPEMEQNIRKIKVLINQFRADPNQEYNKKNGILPQILIYPRYGPGSARIVLSKIDYYFSLYVDHKYTETSQFVWKKSSPSYFIKKNPLIFYSNGSIDLKNYIKDSLSENSGHVNDIFTKDYSELLDSKNIMSI